MRPDDNVCEACPDVDWLNSLYEIEDEFGIKIPDEDMKRMDGKFDVIVRYVASQRRSSHDVENKFQLLDRKVESV